MKARIIRGLIETGSAARDFIRLVKNASSRPIKGMDESHARGAQDILEGIREQEDSGYELDIDITGQNLIDQMDHDFEDLGLVPYWYTDLARSRGEAIHPGSQVFIVGDPSGRTYRTIQVSYDHQSVRVRDIEENEFMLPWELVKPSSSRRNL